MGLLIVLVQMTASQKENKIVFFFFKLVTLCFSLSGKKKLIDNVNQREPQSMCTERIT